MRPALLAGQGLGRHPRERLVASETHCVDAVLDLDGVGEDLCGALPDLGRGARHYVPGPGTLGGEGLAFGQHPVGQTRVELGKPLGRRTDDGVAQRPDRWRIGHGLVGPVGTPMHVFTLRDGLVADKHGQRHQQRDRIRTPSICGDESPEPGLLAPAVAVTPIGSDAAASLGQRIALGTQRLVAFGGLLYRESTHRRAACAKGIIHSFWHGPTIMRPLVPVVGHRARMA
ncbi:Uncharacterised protein [Mycobacteroides abscessus subsp. abscessus]|nr:Uncharacterised protein [Mycobacteroides abscessus subsp. abscessus]